MPDLHPLHSHYSYQPISLVVETDAEGCLHVKASLRKGQLHDHPERWGGSLGSGDRSISAGQLAKLVWTAVVPSKLVAS